LRALGRRAVVSATNPAVPARAVLQGGLDLFRVAQRRAIPVLIAPDRDPNRAEFVRTVAALRPDVALSFYCGARLGRSLRAVFAHAVNYHDGKLPDYRGAMATSFSIFARETESGFAFHHMTGRIDGGPVLFEGVVALDDRSTLDQVRRAKSRRAAAALPRVLERIAAGDPGRRQDPGGSRYSMQDALALSRLTEPGNATKEEIERRIRAFGVVHVTLAGQIWPVTRLRPARPRARLAFETADRRRVEPDRFAGLPRWLWRVR
jgi:methionyl-tRNA formyltransferase